MDKYEYRVKTEQMQEHMEKKQYKKAMEIADTIDWRRVKNVSTLNTVSEIYEYNGEYQKSRDILFVAFDRSPGSRKIAYRLGLLALRIGDIEEAADCYEEFVKLAPKDPNQYILKYKILRAQGAPLSDQIAALEDFKKAEYIEKWAYELARLYHEAGMTAECLEECDDLILWFSEGRYVYQAMELKMQYKPLTPLQQEKYDSRPGASKKSRAAKRNTTAKTPVPLEEVIRGEAPVRKEVLRRVTETALRADQEALEAEEAQEEKDELTEGEASVRQNTSELGKTKSISKVVKGATLQEALANGMALANGIRSVEKTVAKVKEGIRQVTGQIHMDALVEKRGADARKAEPEPEKEPVQAEVREERKEPAAPAAQAPGAVRASRRPSPRPLDKKTDALRATGQLRIEEILQEWETKQKANAEAIERQREEDDERLRRERDEIGLRKELERREAERKAEEERKALETGATQRITPEGLQKLAEKEALRRAAERKAAEEAEARKAEEEEAARKAAEEEAARKAAEEEEIRKEAARKAARKAAKAAARKAAEEEAVRKAAEEEAARKAAEEEAVRKAAEEEAAKKTAEEEALRKAIQEEVAEKAETEKEEKEVVEKSAEEEAARKAAEEEAAKKAAEERAAREFARRAAEVRAAEEVVRKAAEAEAAKKTAEEEAVRKAAEEEATRKAAEEETARKAAEEEATRKAAEEEALRKAIQEEAARIAEEEEAAKKAVEEAARKTAEPKRQAAKKKKVKQTTKENIAAELPEDKPVIVAGGKTQRIPDDIVRLMEELGGNSAEFGDMDIFGEPAADEELISEIVENRYQGQEGEEDIDDGDFDEDDLGVDDYGEYEMEDDFEEEFAEEASGGKGEIEAEALKDIEEDFDEADFAEDDIEDGFGEESEEFEEEDFGEEESEDFEEEDFGEEESEEFEEEDFGEEESEDFEEEDFGEDETEEFEEEEGFGEESEEFEEEDFEEEDYEDEFDDVGDYIEDSDADYGEDEFDEEEFDEDEFEEDSEEEFEEEEFEEEELEEEEDFEEEEFDDDGELEIEEPSEAEIQARIKKSKGKGVPFDTGFVVTGRYDLSATSEIGLKAGLTEEQKKLFSYFVPVRGMSEQLVEVLDNDRRARKEGTSKTGNLLVVGRKGSGKTVLAVDIVKAIQKQRNLKQGKVAIVTGESLNKKELTNIIQKLRGGAIIIEKAGKLNSRTIKELNHLMEKKTGELLFVLEDQRKPLERILTANPEFKKKFTSRLELPVFINDELVTFGQTYAKENGYKLDEMGILALYSRIDVMQREDHAVSVAEVKDIMDEAIEHSQKANVKHLARRVFGKSTDESDRIILKEEDFKI